MNLAHGTQVRKSRLDTRPLGSSCPPLVLFIPYFQFLLTSTLFCQARLCVSPVDTVRTYDLYLQALRQQLRVRTACGVLSLPAEKNLLKYLRALTRQGHLCERLTQVTLLSI